MVYDSNHWGAVKAILFVLCLLMIPASRADVFSCKPREYDPEFPAALIGKYEIIGRMPDSDTLYRGTLEIKAGKKAYRLKRIVNGSTMTGEARIEACGEDGSEGVQILDFEYTKGEGLLEGYCFFHSDLDNDMLLSCYASSVGMQHDRPGLESMFPKKDF